MQSQRSHPRLWTTVLIAEDGRVCGLLFSRHTL